MHNSSSQNVISQFRHVRRFFFSSFKPDAGLIYINYALTIAVNALFTVLIWIIGKNVNHLTGGRYEQLGESLLLLIVIVVCAYLLGFCNLYLYHRLCARFTARLRKRMLSHVVNSSTDLLQRFSKGDLLARSGNDIDRILTFMLEIPLFFFSYSLILVFYIAMLFWISWQLALLAMLLSPVFYVLQRLLAPRKERAASLHYRCNGDLLGYEERALNNLRGINTFNAQSFIFTKHGGRVDARQSWLLKMRVIDVLHESSFAILTYLCAVAIVYVGVFAIQDSSVLVGDLVSFIAYLGYLAFPLKALAHMPLQIKGDYGAAQRVEEIFNTVPQVREDRDAITLNKQDVRGDIRVENLRFRYVENVDWTFRDVNLAINAGETVALVGPSGSGKTTLARLLLRFYDPQQGSIRIDKWDIKTLTLSSLRQSIAIVWQEPFLLNDTIKQNLLLANPTADDKILLQACMRSQSWEFINALERGWDTVIGAEGIELSVGQQQRLSIAQAFLRDAPILILDEASSALDSQSEQAINQALQELQQGRTTIIIAHRFSSIRNADTVIYLTGDGTLTVGNHEQMFATHDGYRDAVNWQTQSK